MKYDMFIINAMKPERSKQCFLSAIDCLVFIFCICDYEKVCIMVLMVNFFNLNLKFQIHYTMAVLVYVVIGSQLMK